MGIPAEHLIPLTRSWMPQVAPTCVSPPHVEVDSKSFTQHLSRISIAAASCYFGEKTRPGKHQDLPLWLSPALLSSSCSSGRLGYEDQRAKCLRRKFKKEKENLFSSGEPKAAQLRQKFILCYRTSGKGRNAGIPAQCKRKLLQTVSLQYVQSMLQASATDTKHTTIF